MLIWPTAYYPTVLEEAKKSVLTDMDIPHTTASLAGCQTTVEQRVAQLGEEARRPQTLSIWSPEHVQIFGIKNFLWQWVPPADNVQAASSAGSHLPT